MHIYVAISYCFTAQPFSTLTQCFIKRDVSLGRLEDWKDCRRERQYKKKNHFKLRVIKQLPILNNNRRLSAFCFINILIREMTKIWSELWPNPYFFHSSKIVYKKSNSNFINCSQLKLPLKRCSETFWIIVQSLLMCSCFVGLITVIIVFISTAWVGAVAHIFR